MARFGHAHRLILLLLLTPLQGCAALGVAFLYKKAPLPASQIVRDIPYRNAASADAELTRLNLFLPHGEGWPTVIFVHGGSWYEGDKDLTVAGADVYNNIGRYFASQDVGAVVISYRLLPRVDWRSQVLDVAKATEWVQRNIARYHGDPQKIFLVGHSAGAQIASRVALDPSVLGSLGLSPHILRGVVAISGVGYNFLDEELYQYGKKLGVIKESFGKNDLSLKQRKNMSPIFYVNKSSPPFLILYAKGDPKTIRNESIHLESALKRAGAFTQVYPVAHESHKSMVLALSRDKTPTELILVFVKSFGR